MNSPADPDQTTAVGAGETRSAEPGRITTLAASEPGEVGSDGCTTFAACDAIVANAGLPPTREIDLVAAPDRDATLPGLVGRYQVRLLIGEGGFGRVYRVFDDQLERDVAVKVPHPQLVPDRKTAEFYLAEARAAARLDHPSIVPVYDVGSSPEFPCFIVSKLIEGQTLAEQITVQWPSFTEAARLVTTVAEALHHAHMRGVIHRDVKPGNILIDSVGRPYVADFGLALRESKRRHRSVLCRHALLHEPRTGPRRGAPGRRPVRRF